MLNRKGNWELLSEPSPNLVAMVAEKKKLQKLNEKRWAEAKKLKKMK